ncbi:hypothetical protein C1645_779902 [Glomus cerebriforme]|uniref:BTB domain-containing protein n=1 Tax=Glomus cerebriforme TaxID=658196 RepID=A0A397SUE3_9GLOM|nr:hypothetical protein C1645_779902 [Glomus cerebriforme]
MSKKSVLHYYNDGDLLIFADNTSFRVHKSILKLAAPKLLQKQEQENDLSSINVPDVSASIMDIALSIIYPRYFVMPTWANVDALLSLASIYTINKVYVAGVTFLDLNFKKNPMYTFYLADKYKLSFLFEETSKLVLDRFPKYKEETAFKRLPLEVQSELIARHMNYIHSFANLSVNHFISTYQHKCSNVALHNKELNQEFEFRALSLVDQPNKSPSTVWSMMHAPVNVTDGISCNNQFMSEHLPKMLKDIFGNFKCLDVDKDEENPKHYIYISRKKS